VASLPGLNGTGAIVANTFVCQEVSAGEFPAPHAKVNIMFRRRTTAPALVFATILFFGDFPSLNPSNTEGVEASNVSLSGSGLLAVIKIDSQWDLRLQRTTVLLRSP
jgi:hypothetical protein